MNKNLKKVLHYAQERITQLLKEKQQQIILQDEFGRDAVLNVEFYKAGDHKHADMLWKDLQQEYEELLNFAKELENIIQEQNNLEDVEWAKAMNDWIKQSI